MRRSADVLESARRFPSCTFLVSPRLPRPRHSPSRPSQPSTRFSSRRYNTPTKPSRSTSDERRTRPSCSSRSRTAFGRVRSSCRSGSRAVMEVRLPSYSLRCDVDRADSRQRTRTADVGGGYTPHDLSDLSLHWLASQVAPFLALDLDYLSSVSASPSAPWGAAVQHGASPSQLPLFLKRLFSSCADALTRSPSRTCRRLPSHAGP